MAFFTGVLNMAEEMNLTSKFMNAGFKPNAQTPYAKSDLIQAVNSFYGAKGIIDCNGKGSDSGKESNVIDTVYYCMDKSLSLIDCPQVIINSNGRSCNKSTDLYLLPIKH